MKCPGIRKAVPRGRTECVPPRKPLFASSPGFPREAFHPGQAHLEGRALHAREERDGFDRGMCPVGHRPFAYESGGDEMPGHPEGRTTRTHRVRPSEKIALRVIPGFSPQGHPTLAGPPLGGAGSARPQRRHRLHRCVSPLGHRPVVIGPGGKGMPRHSYGRTVRTRRPRPSEKTTFHAIPGLAKQASLSPLGRSAEGRLCTPAMRAPASPRHIPLGLARSATHRVGMKCLGIRTALPGGRTECVPPRKSPFALSPGSPRKAIPARITNPAEGRALHARKECLGSAPASPPTGLGQ
jgi:hypothetical protein